METALMLGGEGGQGVQLISTTLANALHEQGRNASMYVTYGAEIRGGPIYCTVATSEEEIGSPIAWEHVAVLAMNQRTYNLYGPTVASSGVVLYNSTLVTPRDDLPTNRQVPIPVGEVALQLGDARVVGMVALGALVRLTGIIGMEELEKSVARSIPAHRQKLLDLNLRAIRRGAEIADAATSRIGGTA